ncbi:MAG: GNAT family N-acetyltransferase [Bacteroidetes bacterium]|nr:GNAT family N-acetyltransferase [Bacteroidota bacterium]
MQFRTALPADIPAIHDLARKIWNQHYPAIIGQEQVNYMLQKIYNADSLKQQMQEGQHFFLIELEKNPVGFLSFSVQNENIFLNKFYIDTSLHRKGLGRLSFQRFLGMIPDAFEIRLQVNRQNYTAINFYFKMGFVIEKVADFDIGDGYFMNDFIMIWRRTAASM